MEVAKALLSPALADGRESDIEDSEGPSEGSVSGMKVNKLVFQRK